MPSFPTIAEHRPLRDICAEVDYFSRIRDVVVRIECAADIASIVELLEEATVLLGAEVSAFLSFVRDSDHSSSFRYLLACDPAWCVEYEAKAWYADDPWLEYASLHAEPIRGTDVHPRNEAQRAVVELAERFGFRSSVLIPAPSSGGLSRLGLLCLGSSQPGYFDGGGWSELKMVARPLAAALHEWWVARLRRELSLQARLTPSDLALLELERRGHGSKRIADLQGRTVASVDSQFQRLIARLQVANRRDAARLAAEYGLI